MPDTTKFLLSGLYELIHDIRRALNELEVCPDASKGNRYGYAYRCGALDAIIETLALRRIEQMYSMVKAEVEAADSPTDNNALSAEKDR